LDPGLEVLVVDDDPLTRMLMKRLLSRLGCNVSTAENGEIALELILGSGGSNYTPSTDHSAGPVSEQSSSVKSDDSKYHVIFLDNQMPVLSGLKTIEKLREVGRGDFVVGVTGNALLDDQQEYLAAGVDHVLTKPVLERSLRGMLLLADERRKRASPSVERTSINA
jgi:CheY-like chemotaxis protein